MNIIERGVKLKLMITIATNNLTKNQVRLWPTPEVLYKGGSGTLCSTKTSMLYKNFRVL